MNDKSTPIQGTVKADLRELREVVREAGRQFVYQAAGVRYGCITKGRLSIYLEPHDVWVGVYYTDEVTYVCPLPMVVFRWHKRGT